MLHWGPDCLWDSRGVARGACPQIVEWVDFFNKKNWLCWDKSTLFSKVTLFSQSEVGNVVFCRPQYICTLGELKFWGGRQCKILAIRLWDSTVHVQCLPTTRYLSCHNCVQNLQPSDVPLLVQPSRRTDLTSHSFCCLELTSENSTLWSPSLAAFQSRFKTHLFLLVYNSRQ